MAKKTAIKFGVPLMALALLLGLILGLGQVAQAQDSEPVQITDPVVLEGLLNGDLSVLNVDGVRAASETVMGYSVRHHWGYPGNLQVYVNNTSNTEFTDFLIQARLKNGQLDDRQLSANMTPKDAYFPRISQETDPVALGVRMSDGGRTDSLHDATICNNGPMVVINRQTNGVSYPVIQNIFVGQTIYYRLVGGANWRQLQNNAYEGWAVQQKQGSIEIKLQATDEAPMCLLVSWDWDYQEQSPLTLIISDTSTVVGTDLMVPVAIRNNTGQVFSIDARLQYSPTHLSFLGIDQVGTLSSGFQYILNTQTPGQIIITGQGTQPITAESGLMLSLKFRALRAGTVPVKLAGVQVSDVLINGGQIPVVGEYGEVTVNASLWTGAVYFWNQNRQLKDVTVTLSNGTETITATTGWDGGYTAPLPTTGTWTATFMKQKSEYDRSAVSSLDAAITHQRAAQLTSFGIPFMEWSADADNRAPITSYDANRILRFVARYVDNDAACGQWRGEEITAEVTGPTSSGHITKMWLMCDVTGNWVPDGTVRAAEMAETPIINTTVVSVAPLVIRVSSDQEFSGLTLQFNQNIQSVTAPGFDTVEPNGGLVPLAALTEAVSSIDLTIVPMEGTEVLIIKTIAIDEYAEVSGPSLTLNPDFPLPCVLDPKLCQVRVFIPIAFGGGGPRE